MASVAAVHVSKRFLLRHDRADSIGQLLVRMLPSRGARVQRQPFWALHDVSFEMPDGKSLGIVGPNGAGKSTLLKILNRTMAPTSGEVRIRGRMSALIELGAGFHPDFTGRENIVLNASILGVPRREVERRMDAIIDFADIRPFIDTPVKYYSSGMHARLGFSVAIHVDPELLVVDEVLSVGDESFQQKCMDRIFEMKRAGVGILLVSHDLSAVERLMDLVVWLHHGRVQAVGRPQEVVRVYRQDAVPEMRKEGPTEPSADTSIAVRLVRAELTAGGRITDIVRSGDAAAFRFYCVAVAPPFAGVHVQATMRRPDGLVVADFGTGLPGDPVPWRDGRRRLDLDLPALPLAAGTYQLDVTLTDPVGRPLARWPAAVAFRIQSERHGAGLLEMDARWSVREW